jgi:hypothetical protein
MIPPKAELPDDPAEWRGLPVSLPLLSGNSSASCPLPISELMEYVRFESADQDAASIESLQFIRTAQIEGSRYWLWSYTELSGDVCYVFLRENEAGNTLRSMTGTGGLSPEQYLLADYYHLIYWS